MSDVDEKFEDIKCQLGKLRERVEDVADGGEEGALQTDPLLAQQERLVGLLCSVTECAEMYRRNIEAATKACGISFADGGLIKPELANLSKLAREAVAAWVQALIKLGKKGEALVDEAINLDRPPKKLTIPLIEHVK